MKSVLVKGSSYCDGCAHEDNAIACIAERLPCWAAQTGLPPGRHLIIKIIEEKHEDQISLSA